MFIPDDIFFLFCLLLGGSAAFIGWIGSGLEANRKAKATAEWLRTLEPLEVRKEREARAKREADKRATEVREALERYAAEHPDAVTATK